MTMRDVAMPSDLSTLSLSLEFENKLIELCGETENILALNPFEKNVKLLQSTINDIILILSSIPHSLIPLFCILLCYLFLQFYSTAILKVMDFDLSLDSISQISQTWNAQLGLVHVLIKNATILSIRGSSFKCKTFCFSSSALLVSF